MTGAALIKATGELMIQIVALGSFLLPPPIKPVYGGRVFGPGLSQKCCLKLYVQAVECETNRPYKWFPVTNAGKINASVIEDGVPVGELLDAPIFFEENEGDGTVYMVPADAKVGCEHGELFGDIILTDACPQCLNCGNHQTPRRLTLRLAGIQIKNGLSAGHVYATENDATPWVKTSIDTLGGSICLCWVGECIWERAQVPRVQPVIGGSFPILQIQSTDSTGVATYATYSVIFDVTKDGDDLVVEIYAAMWIDFDRAGGTFGDFWFGGGWPTISLFSGRKTIGPLCDNRSGYVVNNNNTAWVTGDGDPPPGMILGKKGTVTVLPGLDDGGDCDEHCPFECCAKYAFIIGGTRSSSNKRVILVAEPYVLSRPGPSGGSIDSPRGLWYGGSPPGPGPAIFRRQGRWVALVDLVDAQSGYLYRLYLLGDDGNCPPAGWNIDHLVFANPYEVISGGPLLTVSDFSLLGVSRIDCPTPCTTCCSDCCTTKTFTFDNVVDSDGHSHNGLSVSVANFNIGSKKSGCDWSGTQARLVRLGNKWRLSLGEDALAGAGSPFMVWEATGSCPPSDPSSWALIESSAGTPTMTAVDDTGCPA